MRLTRTFKASGLLTAAGVLLVTLAPGKGGWTALGILLLVFAGSVFMVSAIRALLRGILWRVGSRLVVSYVLLMSAVVFAAFFVYAGLLVIAGQLGTRRVEAAFASRRAELLGQARDLAARGATSPPSSLVTRPWMAERGTWLVKQGPELFAVAIEPRPGGPIVLARRLDAAFRRSLETETGNVIRFLGAVRVRDDDDPARKGKVRISLDAGGKTQKSVNISEESDSGGEPDAGGETAAPPAGSGPWSGRWTAFPYFVRQSVLDAETGKALEKRPVLFLVRTSLAREAQELFRDMTVAGSERVPLSRIVLAVMASLGIATLVVFFLSSLLAGLLVSRIARATRRLSLGFAEIEKGNFAHRVVLKGHDQLAALTGSFNHMAGRLSASVAEKAEKEALEHELSVARDLQRRLLPPADFACPGVEIAVDFAPAAAIGGDFYDLSYAERALTVSIADVSGHGLPTGLVMAAARASLGMLARTGSGGVRLMELLHEEIVRTTERRTFVTLCHLVFDLPKGTASYTNAGHPYPYRVLKDGTVRALANPARPLGLSLSGGWQTVEEPLAPGDFWVVFSDGLVEATRQSTDESWGFERLEDVLRAGPFESAAALKDRILAAQRAFTGRTDTEDDRTLLVLRIDERRNGAERKGS
ncbi:MAG: SpoIIE family protein phosphatase [Acidobacteriota bacterium]|nr:SpoIIE family protein phosphatase [Acidobacteriota bacterium]